jgi:hypothetical protein
MIEFINEPVAVEAKLRPGQAMRPMAFVWRGRRYAIISWGRESTNALDGHKVHCHLVRTTRSETWELCQDTKTALWTLTRHWARTCRNV